jgi:hypothetical protein
VIRISIYFIILFCLIIFGCQDSDVQKRVYNPPQIHVFETPENNSPEFSIPSKNKIPIHWSESTIWDDFSGKDIYATFSHRINKKLPIFKFKIVGKPKDGDFLAKYIEITNPSNKKLQRLDAKDRFDVYGDGWTDSDLNFADLVQFIDLNFDSYLDLRLLMSTGATGNNEYASYIYGPSSGRFKYHHEISGLSGVKVDTRKKHIITYDRMGHCDELMEYYKVVKDKLFLVKVEWNKIDRSRDDEMGGFGCFKYTGIPRNKNIKINADKIFSMENRYSYLKNKLKNIKEEPLYGNLDGRDRGLLGTPID